jgi:uncharacterized protein (PEP-CTERM system associated)
MSRGQARGLTARHAARRFGRPVTGILALAAAASASGQSAGGGGAPPRGFYLTPSISAGATLTDNVRLSETNPQSDLILQLTPGVQIGGQSGRVRGFLDYAGTASLYVKDQERGNFSNSLNARVNAEAVENWLFIDAYADISQEFISPFGSQSTDPSLINENSTEVVTLGISPYITGQVGGLVNYRASANYTLTNSGTSAAPDSRLWGGDLSIDGSTRFPKLGWGITSTYEEYDFSNSTEPTKDLFTVASLSYAITPYLRVSARANTETSNVLNQEKQTTSGWGWGVNWSPSPRTNLSMTNDERFYGSSWDYAFDYRTPNTVWRLTSSQALTTGANSGGRGSPGSPFDLLFSQFARIEPDPVLRAQLVNTFMRANGIDSNASLNTGFLPTEVTEERRQEASVAYVGKRSTITFNAFQTYARSLASAALAPDDDFANGNILRQRGFGVDWAHRLTPLSSVNLRVDQTRTSESLSDRETKLWTVEAEWLTQLAPRVDLSVRARRTIFTSPTSPYHESALIADLTMTF